MNYDILTDNSIKFYFEYNGGYDYKVILKYEDVILTYNNLDNFIVSNLLRDKIYNFLTEFIISDVNYVETFNLNDIVIHYIDQIIDHQIVSITYSSINIKLNSNIYVSNVYLFINNIWVKMDQLENHIYSYHNLLPLQLYNSKLKIITEFKDYITDSVNFETLNTVPIWKDQNIYLDNDKNLLNINFGNH